MQNLMLHKDAKDLEGFGIETVGLEEATQPKPSQLMHRKAKMVPQELLDQALQNNPLETLPRWSFSDEMKASSSFRNTLPQLKEAFLNTHFLMLVDLGITFETPPEEVTRLISEETSQKRHLGAYFAAVHASFDAFQRMFNFVGFITEKGKFDEKHLTSVYTVCTAYAAIGDVMRGARLMKAVGAHVAFNRERYIFELPTVLPTSNLPEVLLAMPVCFFGNTQGYVNNNDPHVSDRARFVCDAVGSKSFAWFYQMYNRRDRDIKNFPSIDPIPSDYLEFRKQLAELADLELIATPYHHIAAQEWENPAWIASIDPIAMALFQNIPFFIITKRWSGNGIFPLLANLMANTIDHIKNNKAQLKNFNPSTYWYKGGPNGNGGTLEDKNLLIKFAEKVVESFSQGKVFELLRS